MFVLDWSKLMLKKGGLTALLLFGMFFGAGKSDLSPQLGFESGGHFGQRLQVLSYLVLELQF